MDRIGLSSHLVRIARMLIIANIVGDFRTAMLKADPSIGTKTLDEMSNFVKSCSSKPKIQKLASYCLVRGFLKWPGGKQDFDTVVRLFGLVNDLNQGMIQSQDDYDRLAYPKKYPNDPECKRYVKLLYGQEARHERATGRFNPDTEFKGRKYTDGVVDIYMLNETPDEMRRVRRVLDVMYGQDRNPWCLAARKDKSNLNFEKGSRNFEMAWTMWKHYSDGPKRIAFAGGRPVALYADGQWWDMGNISHDELPVQGAVDDPEFLIEREEYLGLKKNVESGILTEDEMLELANNDNLKIREILARRNGISKDVIRKLAKDKHENVRKAIARRNDLPEDVVRQLAEDGNKKVRRLIAWKKDLPDDLIRKLAEDDDFSVREKIYRKKGLPDDLIRKLADGDDE